MFFHQYMHNYDHKQKYLKLNMEIFSFMKPQNNEGRCDFWSSSCPNPHSKQDQLQIYIRLLRVLFCFLLLISLFRHFTFLSHSSNTSLSFLPALIYILHFFSHLFLCIVFSAFFLFPHFSNGPSSPSFIHQYFISPVFLDFLSNPSASFPFLEVLLSFLFWLSLLYSMLLLWQSCPLIVFSSNNLKDL